MLLVDMWSSVPVPGVVGAKSTREGLPVVLALGHVGIELRSHVQWPLQLLAGTACSSGLAVSCALQQHFCSSSSGSNGF